MKFRGYVDIILEFWGYVNMILEFWGYVDIILEFWGYVDKILKFWGFVDIFLEFWGYLNQKLNRKSIKGYKFLKCIHCAPPKKKIQIYYDILILTLTQSSFSPKITSFGVKWVKKENIRSSNIWG